MSNSSAHFCVAYNKSGSLYFAPILYQSECSSLDSKY